jgi:hypothetical protein
VIAHPSLPLHDRCQPTPRDGMGIDRPWSVYISPKHTWGVADPITIRQSSTNRLAASLGLR